MTSTDLSRHERYMRMCLKLARKALETQDTPVGSIVARDDHLIAEGIEAVRASGDVTAHAEIVAIRSASAQLGSISLAGCTLYTTVEPCVMCAYAIRLARVAMVVTGARPALSHHSIDGCGVLLDARLLPERPPPLLIRDVLADECMVVRAGG